MLNFIICIIAIILLYTGLNIVGIGCPIKFLTGVSCAGCGMTRAYGCLLEGEIKNAIYYHPLFLLPIVFIVIYFFKNKISKKIYKLMINIIMILFISVYIVRLLNPDNHIVTFNINDGIVFKVLQNVI